MLDNIIMEQVTSWGTLHRNITGICK